MLKRFFVYFQSLLPQHALSVCLGNLADCRQKQLKNWLIRQFIKTYRVDLSEALINDPTAFPTFNDFFIRQLKPGVRPVSGGPNDIVSPADGTIADAGHIAENQLLQAKNSYFNLDTLFGNDTESAELFYNGDYATIYLAPNNYHRVHVPLDAKLIKTIYIPGKLFSVNRMTTDLIPNLYARNERLIALFETSFGPMAVIMVGALIVGSMQPVWMQKPIRGKKIMSEKTTAVDFKKGDELGYFKLGSTVILLFPNHAATWIPALKTGTRVQVGQIVGKMAAGNFPLSKE